MSREKRAGDLDPQDMDACFEKLDLPVRYIKGVGPKAALLFAKKGVHAVEDLLFFFPRKYEDRRRVDRIDALEPGRKATVIGVVQKAGIRYYRKARVFEVAIGDGSGILTAKWFRGKDAYLRQAFKPGRRVILTGDVRGSLFEKEMAHPDYEMIDEHEDGDTLHFKRIVPVYSETEGFRQKHLRKIIREALDLYSRCVVSPLPMDICERQRLEDIHSSIEKIHFPGPEEDVDLYNDRKSPAHRRFVFDEFFFFELAMAVRKRHYAGTKGIVFKRKGDLLESFYRMLPFALTGAQRRAVREIERDMESPHPMHRLLQGDVGCGKTVVAMAALIKAVENGYQGAVMAPTEILAGQHFASLMKWAGPLSVRVGLLTASQGTKERRDILAKAATGGTDVIVGTHALIQERVSFHRLGFVVIDEQHRFGVIQRQILREKGLEPDVLVMTATPIPRTLAMTVYGDLDFSVIDEMPAGKKPVRTKIFYEGQRDRVYEIVRKEMSKGNQVFVVYPLVEESEVLEIRDATRMADHLQKEVFKEFRVGLIHGRMNGNEKEGIMSDFLEGRLNLLVATTVVEVGIDVPGASLMVIEHAERFGLSQLHQLRGRVGRGNIPSGCILMSPGRGSDLSARRLRIMEETSDGFRISEEDLKIRGPGEFMGTKQSGLPDFRLASILRDGVILREAREEAFAILEKDPDLEDPEHARLWDVIRRRWGDRIGYAKTG